MQNISMKNLNISRKALQRNGYKMRDIKKAFRREKTQR
jgi:hypothetical protein